MATTYEVRFWKTTVHKGKRATTYYVRWVVAGREFSAPFKTKALAGSFLAELTTAARKGEAFDTETGRPVSMQRANQDRSWYDHACAFADVKWPSVAATTRRTHAEALTAFTTYL